MEGKSILEKISSKKIFENIFDYIKDPNHSLQLFSHSKIFQAKLDLNIVDYEKSYIERLGINLDDYLFCENNKFVSKFDKDILNQNLEKDLSKYKLEKSMIEKIIVDITQKNLKKNSKIMRVKRTKKN